MQKKTRYWSWNMNSSNVSKYLEKKEVEPTCRIIWDKIFWTSSYTILKGPLEKRHGEWTKAKINASWFKITFVLRWKSSTKEGKSTSTSGWRRWRTFGVLFDGVVGLFEGSARITQTYYPTWARAHARNNCVYGGGVGFRVKP